MTDRVRPMHFPSATALEAVRERAGSALDDWAREWVADRPASAVSCSSITTQAQSCDYEPISAGEGRIWFRRSPSDREALIRAIAGPDVTFEVARTDPWMTAVIDQACEARDRALQSALLRQSVSTQPSSLGELPADLFALGSGALRISCEWLGLCAVVDSSVWRTIPPAARAGQRPTQAAPLGVAVRGAKARLDVVLSSVKIELSQLVDLRYGDVLRLPHRLDQALTVLCEGKPMAHAVLGENQARKCVQLQSD